MTKVFSVEQAEEQVGVSDPYIKHDLFKGRRKRKLGLATGIDQFGVNHTTLDPGAYSALRHWHEAEDEFIYVLSGSLQLVNDQGVHTLKAGDFCGFAAGDPNAHHLANPGDEPATFIEIGSRRPGEDVIHYPDDDFGPIHT